MDEPQTGKTQQDEPGMTGAQLARTLIVLATICVVIAIVGVLIDRHQKAERQREVACVVYGQQCNR